MTTILSQLFRKPSTATPNLPDAFPFTAESNPYRCKRTWPPDFAQLSQKHQFRLERRYRRRTKLKWARPNWTKGVKLVQWGSIAFVVVYGVLFMQVEGMEGKTPFDGVSLILLYGLGWGWVCADFRDWVDSIVV